MQHIGMLNLKQKGVYLSLICYQKENTCFTYDELMFIMSELGEEEKAVMFLKLHEITPGKYVIKWLDESIQQRKEFSESRARNRKGKNKPEPPPGSKKTSDEHMKNISTTHVEHMENVDVNESEIKKADEFQFKPPDARAPRSGKKKVPINQVVYPFQSEEFLKAWGTWKTYKKEEWNFCYKSATTEQAALQELCELSEGHEINALKIIQKSLSHGWKGFFKLKDNEQPGKTIRTAAEKSTELNNAINDLFSTREQPSADNHAA